MKKSHKNEHTKRGFTSYLQDGEGYALSTIDANERAICLWQECNGNQDFSTFGKEQAALFKGWLKRRKNRNGEPLSEVYRYNVMRRLKTFFKWLSMQDGYKINRSDIAYLSLSKQETRVARDPGKRSVPKIENIIKVIETIEPKWEVDLRDRALISFALLTGARIDAIRSLPIRAFDEETLIVDQNPKLGVKTKFSKRISTRFFPIRYDKAVEYFLEWYQYLKREKGFGPRDPIFPQTVVENGKENLSYRNTGKVKPVFWSSSNAIRSIFQKRFSNAEVSYYHPHSFRHLIVKEVEKLHLTERQKKAVSQNLGHANVGTTFGSYGSSFITEGLQIEIIKKIQMGKEKEDDTPITRGDMKQILEAIERNKNRDAL